MSAETYETNVSTGGFVTVSLEAAVNSDLYSFFSFLVISKTVSPAAYFLYHVILFPEILVSSHY